MGSSSSTEAGCVLDDMEGEPAYRDHVLSANDMDRMDGFDISDRPDAASPRAVANRFLLSPPSAAPGAHGSLSDSGERTLSDCRFEQSTPAAGSAAWMQGGSLSGSTSSYRSEDTPLAAATLANIDRIAWMLQAPLPVSQRASSGLRCTSTSRLVPNQHTGALALFAARVRSRRTEQHARESDASALSATQTLFSSHQGCMSSQTSPSSRPCSISTAMERIMRVERMRAGKVRATSRPKPVFVSVLCAGPLSR
jgi:hypothetical protein